MIDEENSVASLKTISILVLVNYRCRFPEKDDSILSISENLIIDYYLELSKQNKTEDLKAELNEFSTFVRLLKNYKNNRLALCRIYLTITRIHNRDLNNSIIKDYLNDYKLKVQKRNRNDDSIIALGYRIGSFLNEIALFCDSCDFLNIAMDLCLQSNDYVAALSCCIKLLHSYVSFGSMKKAIHTYNLTQMLLQKLNYQFWNLVECHTVFSRYFFLMGSYQQAMNEAVKGLNAMHKNMELGSVIDLMNYGSEACARKNFFHLANKICRFCSKLSSGYYGGLSRFIVETLWAQARFQSSVKLYSETVTLFNSSLNCSKRIFGETGFYTSICYSQLSYAQYINDYRTQRFDDANEYADNAIEILKLHTESNNFNLINAERIKGIILEEIAALFHPVLGGSLMLAEKMHIRVLKVTIETFGEYSSHAAKVYAILGRLYQTLNMLTIAEKMHLKALHLKQNLLDRNDYEVALSASYLGSLYLNLKKYKHAEHHYKMAIDILVHIHGECSPLIKVHLNSLVYIYETTRNQRSRRLYLRKLDEVNLKEPETLRNVRLTYPDEPVTLQDVLMECYKSLYGDKSTI